MAEKRFTQKDEDDWEILDRNKHFAYAHSGYQAEKIIQELNELVETNRELYKDNKQLKKEIEIIDEENENLKNITFDKQRKTIIDLTKENEQLKQQIKDMQIRFKRKYDYEFDEIVDELDLGDVND